MSQPKYTNKLIHEKSPYLLQHAHNPVDWYPWGEEAFQAAKIADKPIFLSIGYATCHWCHVMERESFSNVEVADLMNESFINIKVDREELPEVDHLYMEFAQTMMAGTAGWPLNIVLTPELKPFFAATYLPLNTDHGLLGVRELVDRITTIWHSEERQHIETQSDKIVDIYIETAAQPGEELPFEELVEDAADVLFQAADATYGGLKGTPKFPIGYHINFLLSYSAIHRDGRAGFLAEKTLDMMYKGGIYDHLGGGFSRYSIDEHWLIPHFEKMLYDNAILAQGYSQAWLLMEKPLYAAVATKTLDYILDRMTHKEGGFYSAEDSEVDGEEGKYYTWSFEEIKSIVSKEDLNLVCNYFDITPRGNFNGRNILNTPLSLEEFSQKYRLEKEKVEKIISENEKKLLESRSKKKAPQIDDKILSSWNGLMIHTMALVGNALGKSIYTEAALKAAQFIKSTLWKEGILLRRWRDGSADFRGNLDDYATMIRASITLFESDFGIEWLAWAMEMTNFVHKNFKVENGAFYKSDGSDPHLLVRRCQFSDGAEPSGNSVHCENLLRLYQITAHEGYLTQAEDIFRSVMIPLENYPPGYIYHVMNMQRYFNPHAPTIVVALNENEEHKEEIQKLIYQRYIPHRMIVWRRVHENQLFEKIPFLQEQHPVDGKTTLYICHKGACKEPLNELGKMRAAIARL